MDITEGKEVVVKNKEGKKIFQMYISETQLQIAEKLGISPQQYIVERVKAEMKAKGKLNANNDK